MGAGLAAFYLLPAIYEQQWVNISEAVGMGSRPQDNFLFVHTTDADHDAFNHIITWIALLEMAGTIAAAWALRAWRKDPAKSALWHVLTGWGAVCGLLMFSFSAPAWRWLPKLEFMQFPWRWLLCLSMVFTILVAAGLRHWWMRAAVCLAVICVIATAWHRVQAPWWDTAADLKEMQDNMADKIGYEGTDEYTPVGADPAAMDKNARNVTVLGPAHAAIRVSQWSPERKVFSAELSAPDRLAVKLFPYPAWRVEVNGREVKTVAREGSGQMLVPVEAGMNHVEVRFVRTWDRTAGGWISILCVLGGSGHAFWRRRSAA